jgi:hypothetical protein
MATVTSGMLKCEKHDRFRIISNYCTDKPVLETQQATETPYTATYTTVTPISAVPIEAVKPITPIDTTASTEYPPTNLPYETPSVSGVGTIPLAPAYTPASTMDTTTMSTTTTTESKTSTFMKSMHTSPSLFSLLKLL